MGQLRFLFIGWICFSALALGVPAHYRTLVDELRSLPPVDEAGDSFSFQNLRELIETRDLRSIEDVLPLLPESLRTKYVLIETSKSLQGATERDPRAVLYANRGRFVLTFNGDPTQRGYRSLELMEYHDAHHNYEFRRIDFPQTGPAVFSEPNPKRCQGCHQNPIRPNWGRYPFWPGAVGEKDILTAEAKAKFERFIQYGDTHPRYRYLKRAENLANIENQTLQFTPAFNLDVHFDLIDEDRLSHWLQQTQAYKTYKYAALAALVDCENLVDFIPNSVVHGGAAQMATLLRDTQQVLSPIPEPNKRLLDELEYRITTNLRYIFERRGISIRTWAKSFETEYLMTTVSGVFFENIAWELYNSDPELKKIGFEYASLLRHYGRIQFPTLYKAEDEANMSRSCASLKRASLAAFSGAAPWKPTKDAGF
ncbi:MAG: hypothetical protein KDD51_02925 [Bdellovibrionales bacterium]|nr:hypothetical protein [Bdellovibrionales bacterium]